MEELEEFLVGPTIFENWQGEGLKYGYNVRKVKDDEWMLYEWQTAIRPLTMFESCLIESAIREQKELFNSQS